MRELGREPLLVPERGCEPVEQPVEGRRELRQLVRRLAEAKTLVEVALAPSRRLPRHADDRLERMRQQPPGSRGDEAKYGGREDERADQRRAPGLLVRRE